MCTRENFFLRVYSEKCSDRGTTLYFEEFYVNLLLTNKIIIKYKISSINFTKVHGKNFLNIVPQLSYSQGKF